MGAAGLVLAARQSGRSSAWPTGKRGAPGTDGVRKTDGRFEKRERTSGTEADLKGSGL